MPPIGSGKSGNPVPRHFLAAAIDPPPPYDEVHLADANQHRNAQGRGNPVRQNPPGLLSPLALPGMWIVRRPRRRPARELSAILCRDSPRHHHRRQGRNQHRRTRQPLHGFPQAPHPSFQRKLRSRRGIGQRSIRRRAASGSRSGATTNGDEIAAAVFLDGVGGGGVQSLQLVFLRLHDTMRELARLSHAEGLAKVTLWVG